MSEFWGNALVLLLIALAVGLAVRSLWKQHKSGGGCSGNCASCGGCGHTRTHQTKK